MTSSTPDDQSGRWLSAGTVGPPHGLDGSFHVHRATPQLLDLQRTVFVAGAERIITRRAGTDTRPILRLDGCRERADAEALRGEQLLSPRADAPPLGPDEWWSEDLEGCRVTAGHQPLGTVRQVLALPSCEVLEVVTDQGGELLVPLVSDAVHAVDVEQREIEVDLKFLGGA